MRRVVLLGACLRFQPVSYTHLDVYKRQGILKAGALAVPLNFRYTADEIDYCMHLAEADALVFGPEFIGRVEELAPTLAQSCPLFYVGSTCPTFAERDVYKRQIVYRITLLVCR